MAVNPPCIAVMIDSMVHDKIVDDPLLRSAIEAAKASGHLKLVTTHIQQNQLRAMPNANRRKELRKVAADSTPTSAAVWDVSIWGEAKWGTESGHHALTELSNGKIKHIADALIALTASDGSHILVTDDRRLARNASRVFPSLQIMTTEQFYIFVNILADEPR